jgi:integrase
MNENSLIEKKEICVGLLLSSSGFFFKKENELFFRLRVQHPNKKYLLYMKNEVFQTNCELIKDQLTNTFFFETEPLEDLDSLVSLFKIKNDSFSSNYKRKYISNDLISSPFFTSKSLAHLIEGTPVSEYLGGILYYFPFFSESDLLILIQTIQLKFNIKSEILNSSNLKIENELQQKNLEFCKQVCLNEEFFISKNFSFLWIDSQNSEKLSNLKKSFRKWAISSRDILEFNDILKILSYLEKTTIESPLCRHRHIASVILLYLGGFRISELLQLTKKEINAALENSKRLIENWKDLEKYQESFDFLFTNKKEEDFIFTGFNSSKPLERSTFTHRLNTILREATRKNISSHNFRVMKIETLIEKRGLQQAHLISGYASILSTHKYTDSLQLYREGVQIFQVNNTKWLVKKPKHT